MRIEEYHRGDVFFADLGSLDLGELYYHRQAGARPVVIVQNDVGCFFSETLTIVPLTSQLKRPDLESHYILQKAGFLKKRSMALAEAILLFSGVENLIESGPNPEGQGGMIYYGTGKTKR